MCSSIELHLHAKIFTLPLKSTRKCIFYVKMHRRELLPKGKPYFYIYAHICKANTSVVWRNTNDDKIKEHYRCRKYFWWNYFIFLVVAFFLKIYVQNCCLMLLYLMLRDISLTESSSVCASLYCSRLLLPPDVML